MAAQGATLQNYNNELVKCVDDLKEKREEVNKAILKDVRANRSSAVTAVLCWARGSEREGGGGSGSRGVEAAAPPLGASRAAPGESCEGLRRRRERREPAELGERAERTSAQPLEPPSGRAGGRSGGRAAVGRAGQGPAFGVCSAQPAVAIWQRSQHIPRRPVQRQR